MKEQFVPYELALKLKELGFNEECFGYYDCTSLENPELVLIKITNRDFMFGCAAPLWQQAFDWLLKEHNLYGVIIPTITMCWTFKTMTVVEYIVEVPPYNHVDGTDYSTIEEAHKACLEKLIELVETKKG